MRPVFTALITALALLAVACGSGTSSEPTEAATSPSATPTDSPAASAGECSFEQSVPLVFASILQVITESGHGTAFYIGGGEFLTAALVVSTADTIQLRGNAHDLQATVTGTELSTGIAILQADADGLDPLEFGDTSSLRTEQLIAIAGYPRPDEDEPSLSSGQLAGVVEDPDFGFGTFLQTDAAVNPGNNGAPVIDQCGAVVGMVIPLSTETDLHGIGWAVAGNTLHSALPRVRRNGPESVVRGATPTPAPTGSAGPQPTTTATATPTPQPTATPTPQPTATPTPTLTEGGYTVVEVLDQIYADALDIAGRVTAAVGETNDGTMDYPTAATVLRDLEDTAYGYSDFLLSDEVDLSEFGESCDLARQWYGDAVYYFGISAGYYGLAFELWPDYSLDNAGDASDEAYASLGIGLDYHYACSIGE